MTLLETIVRTAVPVDDDTFERGLVIDQTEFGFICHITGPHAWAGEEHDVLETVIENAVNQVIVQLGWKRGVYATSPNTELFVEADTGKIIATGFPVAKDPNEIKAIDAIRRNPNPYGQYVFTVLPLTNGWEATHRHVDDPCVTGSETANTLAEAILKAVDARS